MSEMTFTSAKAPLAPASTTRAPSPSSLRQRQARDLAGPAVAPPIVHDVLASSGQPLDAETQAEMGARFGHDFSQVRVHTDAYAAKSAEAVNARAFTAGHDIAFGVGQYAPASTVGKHLLAHELAHVKQQRFNSQTGNHGLRISEPGDTSEQQAERASELVTGQGSGAGRQPSSGPAPITTVQPMVQRELLTYSSEHTEYLPSFGESASVTYEVYTGDTQRVQRALQTLISAGKVGVRNAGDRSYFFNSGATRTELSAALISAGFPRGAEMADALLDGHNTSLYSQGRVTKMSSLFTFTLDSQSEGIERLTERPLTNEEITEARLVFGASLDVSQITVAEDPIMGIGGYARTTPSTVNFPSGSFGTSGFMPWLIHELTHSWQYQHGTSLATTFYHSIFSTYDYGGEAGLQNAQASGRHFTDFNTEQQGDILRDYYRRLKAGSDVSAWQPFVDEVKRRIR
ncbi:MAG TPA: DUF4157 domain-containing protein [Ktedonobacterales bacterium]|nr:DUF4157 domain-containing protein [Ktedonobacterales bacterium]